MGSWSSPSAQHTFGRLGLAAGEGGEAQGAKGLSCGLWVGCGGGGHSPWNFAPQLSDLGTTAGPCRSWKRPDASCCVASSAHAPAFLSPLSVLGAVLCTLPCNRSYPGRWVRLSSLNRRKLRPRGRKGLAQGHTTRACGACSWGQIPAWGGSVQWAVTWGLLGEGPGQQRAKRTQLARSQQPAWSGLAQSLLPVSPRAPGPGGADGF